MWGGGFYRSLFLLLPACLLIVACSSLASSLDTPTFLFLGIAPQDEEYFSADVIACRDGSKSFRKVRLNDGFCDCPDGTDEPGTSACPESKFYCRNVGDTPIFLFSSRVNDHFCDCCDGSDEYDGGISCPNTCSKDANVFNGSATYDSEMRNLNHVNGQRKRNRVDLEDLIRKLIELRIAIIVELVFATCVITFCLFHRRTRSRRRHHWMRN